MVEAGRHVRVTVVVIDCRRGIRGGVIGSLRMTGGVESARHLRPRSSSNLSVPTSDEVRQTRAAAKRSAMEETSKVGSSAMHPKKRAVQPVRKRAALANISNQQQNWVGSTGARPVTGIADVKPVELKASQITHGDENAYPGNHPPLFATGKLHGAVESQLEPVSRSSSEAIASLERRTVQNLYISKEAKDRVKQGTVTDKAISCTPQCGFLIAMRNSFVEFFRGLIPE